MMFIIKPIIICVITAMLIVVLKTVAPQFVLFAAIMCGILVMIFSMPYINNILNIIDNLQSLDSSMIHYIKPIIKIISIATICEFATQLCNDCGQGYISTKIIFFGKVIILASIIPIMIEFIAMLAEMVSAL